MDRSTTKGVSEILAEQYARIFTDRFSQINPEDWRRPWISPAPCPAQNISGNVYSGGNQFFLSLLSCARGWEHPLFLTDRQCDRLGLHVTKGEHAFPIACVREWMKDESGQRRPSLSPQAWKDLPEEDRKGYVRRETLLYFKGYNISQTDFAQKLPERMDNIRERYSAAAATVRDIAVPEADRMIRDQTWLCPVREIPTGQAFFSRTDDSITVPRREQFADRGEFYGTLFHEMAHSTGTPERLGRDMEGGFGSPQYAREELVAELGSAILCTKAGIGATISEHNLQYLRSWTEALGGDPRVITGIIQDASRAADMIDSRLNLQMRPVIDLSDMKRDLQDAMEKDSAREKRTDRNRDLNRNEVQEHGRGMKI